jgi:hypothetical protein
MEYLAGGRTWPTGYGARASRDWISEVLLGISTTQAGVFTWTSANTWPANQPGVEMTTWAHMSAGVGDYSASNLKEMVLADKVMNGVKEKFFSLKNPGFDKGSASATKPLIQKVRLSLVPLSRRHHLNAHG